MTANTRREPLTRERILRAALEVVDREGLDAISMRRLGQALGVEAMSLYHHVPHKAAVLDGVFEAVLAELPVPAPKRTWKGAMRARARALRVVLRAHPNVLPLFATRPAVTPGSLRHVEDALGVLMDAGFTIDAALTAVNVVTAFVVGHTLATDGPAAGGARANPAYGDVDATDFPRVAAAAAVLAEHGPEAEFEAGLAAMVAGLGRRVRG